MEPLLTLQDVACRRGRLPVLSGVSLTVSRGEAVILRGPNGAGKTTLLRTVAGLQPVAKGTLNVDADAVGYSGHADGVKSTLTVSENLTFWAQLFGQKDIEPALEAYDLTPLRDRMAGALSAGQRRRLGLARLLVTGRTLWVMDEPTVSLDVASVGLFVAAVESHLARGGALLAATHLDFGFEARTIDVAAFKATKIEVDEAFL